jgi:hypothetical protein
MGLVCSTKMIVRSPTTVTVISPPPTPEWSPLDDPGLQAWYDPSDPLYRTLDINGNFDSLADKSPVGREPVVQNVSANRPTLGTLGGRQALGLDGTRWLQGSWNISLSAVYMSIVVADVTGADATYVLVDNASTANGGAIFFGTGTWRSTSSQVLNSGDTIKNGLRAHAAANGVSGAYYIDDFGTPKVTGNNGTTAANGRTIGRNIATSGTVVGVIGDHIVTTSTDLTTRTNYAAWLTARYSGLTVTV